MVIVTDELTTHHAIVIQEHVLVGKPACLHEVIPESNPFVREIAMNGKHLTCVSHDGNHLQGAGVWVLQSEPVRIDQSFPRLELQHVAGGREEILEDRV